MKRVLRSSKIVIISMVMALVVAVGGVVTAVNLLSKNETQNPDGFGGAKLETSVTNADNITYDKYLSVAHRGSIDNNKSVITFDKYLENINNAGGEGDSDTELLENRTDDQFKINCDYLTGDGESRENGIDGVLGEDEINLSPKDYSILVDKSFNSDDREKSVRFELDPIKGVDFRGGVANYYFISKINIQIGFGSGNPQMGEVDILGSYKDGIITYTGESVYGVYEYSIFVNLSTYTIKFKVDEISGKLSFDITSNSEWIADEINFTVTMKLRDKTQKNNATIIKDGQNYYLTNSSDIFSLTDGGTLRNETFNNPIDGNRLNQYTVDDLLTYYLTGRMDVSSVDENNLTHNKMLKTATIGNVAGNVQYNWFTVSSGIYVDGYFFFEEGVKNQLVSKGILEAVTVNYSSTFENKIEDVKSKNYYRLKKRNTGKYSDYIAYLDESSCILLNGAEQCLYIKYDSSFLNRAGVKDKGGVIFNAYEKKSSGGSSWIEFSINTGTSDKNLYQKFELDFYTDGRVLLYQWGIEQKMSVVFDEQYYYIVEFAKMTDGKRLTTEAFDYADVRVILGKGGASQSTVENFTFRRSDEDTDAGKREETFPKLIAGVGDYPFNIETNIKLGVNYKFHSASSIDSSKIGKDSVLVNGENKQLEILYSENVQIGKRFFVAMLSGENIKPVTVKLNLIYNQSGNNYNFQVSGTTMSLGYKKTTGSWGSLAETGGALSYSSLAISESFQKQFLLVRDDSGNIPILKMLFDINLPSGFYIDGGRYWYKDKGEETSVEITHLGYSVSSDNLDIFAGYLLDGDGNIIEDNSSVCIEFYVKPITIIKPLYVAYDSSIYENTDDFLGRIDTLQEAIKNNSNPNLSESSFKIGSVGSELYKLEGYIQIKAELIIINSTNQLATTSIYFKGTDSKATYKKLDIGNLPEKEGYAFLGLYSSMEGVSSGAYSGIGHMGNTNHNGMVYSNIIESSGAQVRYTRTATVGGFKDVPVCYELFIGGQFMSHDEWSRQVRVFGREYNLWKDVFSKYFVEATTRTEGVYYTNEAGELSLCTSLNINNEEWKNSYKYVLKLYKIARPNDYSYVENIAYFDKNGLSSVYTGGKSEDWKNQYCYRLAESMYSYEVQQSSLLYELRLVDSDGYDRFFTYASVGEGNLREQWNEVFARNFKKITQSALNSYTGVFYNQTGRISKTYSSDYSYVLKDASGSNEVFSSEARDKNLVYLNKLDCFDKSLGIDNNIVFYALFDSVCYEKDVVLKDYNFAPLEEDQLSEIYILGKGYIYTDTDLFVLEKLVGENRIYKNGSTESSTAIYQSPSRLTYNAENYPILSSEFALELYPIANPEFLSQNQRISHFTTERDPNKFNWRYDRNYLMDANNFKVDRKRVEGYAVYHLADIYHELNEKSTWYVVPTELEYAFNIVSVDANHQVKDDEEKFTKFNDAGNFTTREYEKVKYGSNISNLLSYTFENMSGLVGVNTKSLHYTLTGVGSLGILDETEVKIITGENLRGYNLYGFIPFTIQSKTNATDKAVEFNFELLKDYFGWKEDELIAKRNEYFETIKTDDGKTLKLQFVLEAVEKLDKASYFLLMDRLAQKYNTNRDSVTTTQLLDSFIDQSVLEGLKYTILRSEGSTQVSAYDYHLTLLTEAIDRQVALDILEVTPFVAVDKFVGSIFEIGNITTFVKDALGNFTMVSSSGESMVDASFMFYRDVFFLPIFVSKDANISFDASGKVLLDNEYLYVDVDKTIFSKINGSLGSLELPETPETPESPESPTEPIEPIAEGEEDGGGAEGEIPQLPTRIDILKFVATTGGFTLENEGIPSEEFSATAELLTEILSTSVRVNKRISVSDIRKLSLFPKLSSGYYISGIDGVLGVSELRLIDYTLVKNENERTFSYTSNLCLSFFESFTDIKDGGSYYRIKDNTLENRNLINMIYQGFLYVGENGICYWDVFDNVKFEFRYSPFKYDVSFGVNEAVDSEFENNNNEDALNINNVGLKITSDISIDSLDSTVIGFSSQNDSIYSGGRVYVFNKLVFHGLAIKDDTLLGEGKYISKGVFVARINISYSTIFDSDSTVPNILGIEFVIKTDKKGLPYVFSKQIVSVIKTETGDFNTAGLVDITEESVGKTLFDALNYDFTTDNFVLDMEALVNADNVINKVKIDFTFDYKTYVLSFNAGLYQLENFNGEDEKINPLDPASINKNSTVYYLVKYNDRKFVKTWVPCDADGVTAEGETFYWQQPEMIVNGEVFAFSMDSIKRLLEVTTMYDGKPKYFSFWVRDARGVGLTSGSGDSINYEELLICYTEKDENGEEKKDENGNLIWVIDNVFDSESGGSFDYYTLFVNEADINVHYYTWNPLKSTLSTNGYIITAHKGYFFGAEPDNKKFFTVNAFENYTFGGNTNEKYYIVGWLKVYDNISIKEDESGKSILDEFTHQYFDNRTAGGMIVDNRTKQILNHANPYCVAGSNTTGYLYSLNQQITVPKRDVVDENLGVINIYMFAIYAKVDHSVMQEASGGSGLNYTANTYVPNTPEMGNLVDGQLENPYQFINFPIYTTGNDIAKSNIVSYWAKINPDDYANLLGLYFNVKDMMNSGALPFTILVDEDNIPIKNTITSDQLKEMLETGEVLINFYCRTNADLRMVLGGININGITSEIIAGAIRVGTMGTDSFKMDVYEDLNLNADGTIIGVLDEESPLKSGNVYYNNYRNALSELAPLKTEETLAEYKKRELLARTSLQLTQWANRKITSTLVNKNVFTFTNDAEDISFDFLSDDVVTLENEYMRLLNIINFITAGEKYNGSTEIKINSASFVRLCYAICAYSLVVADYTTDQLAGIEKSVLATLIGQKFSVVSGEETIYFTGENSLDLSGGENSKYMAVQPIAPSGEDIALGYEQIFKVGDIVKFEYEYVVGSHEVIKTDGSIEVVYDTEIEVYYAIYIGKNYSAEDGGITNNNVYLVSASPNKKFNVESGAINIRNDGTNAYVYLKHNKSTAVGYDVDGYSFIRVF